MPSTSKYDVKFVGYSADVLFKRKGRDVEYAKLDFVFGTTRLSVDGGSVTARHLGPFVNDLPNIVAELEELLKELASSPGGKACRGPCSATRSLERSREILIAISAGAEIRLLPNVPFRQFVRKAIKRFAKVEQVIEQAKSIGNSINRRPYDEYMDEIAKTGIARLEYYGFALFVDGNLRFYPERRTVLVKPQDDYTFLVQDLKGGRRLLN